MLLFLMFVANLFIGIYFFEFYVRTFPSFYKTCCNFCPSLNLRVSYYILNIILAKIMFLMQKFDILSIGFNVSFSNKNFIFFGLKFEF